MPRTAAAPLFRRTVPENGAMNLFRLPSRTARVAAALFLCAAAPMPAPPEALQPHRAVYAIGLAHANKGSGITSAEGQMVFELTGSACTGYTMRQRMVVNLGNEDGSDGLLDFRIATFESGNGDLFRFTSRTTVNAEVIENLQGEAKRTPSAIEVKLEKPAAATVTLAAETLFPSQHLHAVLQAARADKRFVAAEIYEGASSSQSADSVTAAIGRAERGAAGDQVTAGVRNWAVSIGYFSKSEPSAEGFGEEMPSYQMSFRLYENGITKDLVMNYGKYALSGTLEKVEPLENAGCD